MKNGSTIHIDGRKIKHFREQKKLTQLYLATAVEVTTETISRWENKDNPSIKKENALRLVQALDVQLSDLVVSEDHPGESINSTTIENKGNQVLQNRPWRQHFIRILSLILLVLTCIITVIWFFDFSPNNRESIHGYRFIPNHVLPGQVFPVVIQVTHSGYQGSYMLREEIPASCSLLESKPEVATQK
jgi:transcriptional regulator with XRE-family HTH domain